MQIFERVLVTKRNWGLCNGVCYPWSPLFWFPVPATSSLQHVPFGRIRGMSSRRGEMVLLEELLDEARARAARAMEATNTTRVSGEEETEAAAEALGLAGVVANALRSRRGRDVVFDWDQALHARGDSGLTLQYAHARLCSLEEKADCPLDLK
ncbi:unnamed protein product, partial [Ixodes pacificus]